MVAKYYPQLSWRSVFDACCKFFLEKLLPKYFLRNGTSDFITFVILNIYSRSTAPKEIRSKGVFLARECTSLGGARRIVYEIGN